VILVDNLRRRLDSAALSGALTAVVWEDRVLNFSSTTRAPVRCVWIATGNNPALSNEIARRTVRIRLDAGIDRPWLREGFRHPDLRAWMAECRSALVGAALTLVQSWWRAGKPDGQLTMGNFEQWAHVMGGILSHAQIPGFLENLEAFYDDSDDDMKTWSAFVMAWAQKHGVSVVGVADLFPLAETSLDLGDKGERSQRTRLGMVLKTMRDRVFTVEQISYRILAGKPQRGGVGSWRLEQVR
jgi:hypothetical protein